MLNKFNQMDNSKKIPIIIGVSFVLIIIIIVLSVSINNTSAYKYLKEDNNKGLIYTIDYTSNDLYRVEVPYVNINGSFGKSINEDIDSYVSDYINSEKLVLSYDYNINGKVLSLVIKVVNYNTKNIPEVYFKTYNINLEDQVLLSDEDLLSIYGLTSEDVEASIENKFNYWFKQVIKKGYINEEECDYDCFLNYRDVENYLDDIAYYIDKGKLVCYKPFVFYSIFGEEAYFKEEDFKFILSK